MHWFFNKHFFACSWGEYLYPKNSHCNVELLSLAGDWIYDLRCTVLHYRNMQFIAAWAWSILLTWSLRRQLLTTNKTMKIASALIPFKHWCEIFKEKNRANSNLFISSCFIRRAKESHSIARYSITILPVLWNLSRIFALDFLRW